VYDRDRTSIQLAFTRPVGYATSSAMAIGVTL